MNRLGFRLPGNALVLALLVLSAMAVLQRQARGAVESGVEAVTGVRWCRGPHHGFFRLVVAPDADSSYQTLAVQVLRANVAEQTVTLEETIPIVETQGRRLRFSDLQMRPAEGYDCDDALVEGTVESAAAPARRDRLRLRVSSSGHYSFKLLSE